MLGMSYNNTRCSKLTIKLLTSVIDRNDEAVRTQWLVINKTMSCQVLKMFFYVFFCWTENGNVFTKYVSVYKCYCTDSSGVIEISIKFCFFWYRIHYLDLAPVEHDFFGVEAWGRNSGIVSKINLKCIYIYILLPERTCFDPDLNYPITWAAMQSDYGIPFYTWYVVTGSSADNVPHLREP